MMKDFHENSLMALGHDIHKIVLLFPKPLFERDIFVMFDLSIFISLYIVIVEIWFRVNQILN